MLILPIDSAFPSYRLSTAIDGVQYIVDVRWNERDEAWYLDLLSSDGDPIKHGMKIALGTKLGRRCVDPRFPTGAIIARDLTGNGNDAGRYDLGTRVQLRYYSADEITAERTARGL